MTTARDALRTTSIYRFSTYENNLNFLNQSKHIKWHVTLRLIYSLVGKIPCSYGQIRKRQVVLTRCLLGHDIFILCSFSSCSIVVFIWVQQYQQFNTVLYFISYFVFINSMTYEMYKFNSACFWPNEISYDAKDLYDN